MIDFNFSLLTRIPEINISNDIPIDALVGHARTLTALQTFLNVTKPLLSYFSNFLDLVMCIKSDAIQTYSMATIAKVVLDNERGSLSHSVIEGASIEMRTKTDNPITQCATSM